MTETICMGRLCNQIIRNIAVSFIAKKNDLQVTYYNKDLISELGIDLFSGSKVYNSTKNLHDDNYIEIYTLNNIDYNLDANSSFFQTRIISNMIYEHLRSDAVKNKIMEKNPYNHRYNSNNDLYVHIRLRDTAQYSPGIKYFLKAIGEIQTDTIYLSSDELDHPIVSQLLEHFPNIVTLDYDEINTIQFASTCKHIVLSHGSFSALIGYLAFFSNIYYPEYEVNKIWYGDIFSICGWNKISGHLRS